jgi:hypothetical protein
VILCACLLRALRIKKLEAEAFQNGVENIPHPLNGLLPFRGIFTLTNSFQLSAFLGGIVLFLFRFSAQFINGLYEAVAVNSVELSIFLVSVAVDLVLDLLLGLLLYFSAVYFATYMHKKEY